MFSSGDAGDGARRTVHPHQQQSDNHRDVAHRVGEEAPAFADLRHQNAGDGRTDHARAIEHGGVQRDRIHQVVLAHHIHQKRLPPGNVEGVHHPQQRGQHENMPDLVNRMQQGESGQNEGQQHRRGLGADHYPLRL